MATIEAAINFQGMGHFVRNSFNVTSITDVGSAYQLNFTTPISNVNYVALCNGGNGSVSTAWFAQGPITANPTVNNFTMWSGTTSLGASLEYTYCIIYVP